MKAEHFLALLLFYYSLFLNWFLNTKFELFVK